MYVAVSEIASGFGKSAKSSQIIRSKAAKQLTPRSQLTLRKLVSALLIGLFSVNQSNAVILANQAAPGQQQATVLSTASGIDQINIQTPNSAGVSMNSYSLFNINKNGAILNNSPSNVSARLAGYITANPNLFNGSAAVIVNQVVSPNPSTINGFIEVAGQKAEVVIANPSGISVNGGGFINTSRAVLTTGVPLFNASGQVSGYAVQDGQINITGSGINYGDTPYAAIMARSVQVNAQLLANDLAVTTGANAITVNPNDGTNAAFSASAQAPNANKPQFALDVSNLGSMYANKIFLLGTEQGVGVNNAGTIGATAGNFVLSNTGQVINTGALSSSNNLDITAQGLNNSGGVYAQQNVHLNSSASVQSSGVLGANQNITLNVNGSIVNSGVLGAGLDAAGSFANAGQNTTISSHGLTNSGNIYATNNTAISSAGALVNNSGIIGSQNNLTLNSSGGDITNTGRLLSSVSPSGAFNTGSVAGNTNITTDSNINNQAGLIQSGGATAITAVGNLDNSAQGKIVSSSDVTLASANLNNNTGNLVSNGNVALTTANLTNNGGAIAALGNGNSTINASNISNGAGYLQAGGNQTINATDAISSAGGFILSGANQSISTKAINNAGGIIQAKGNQTIQASDITNSSGVIASANLNLNANSLSGDGVVSASGNAQINLAQDFSNLANGSIQSGNDLALTTSGNLTNAGTISALGALAVKSGGAISNSNTLVSGGDMTIANAGSLTNAAGAVLATNGNLASVSGGLINNAGTISAGKNASLTSSHGSVTNSGSWVAGENSEINSAGALSNSGNIGANGNLTIAAGDSVNNASQMTAGGNLALGSASSMTNGGKIGANGTQAITSGGSVINSGELSSNGNQTINASGDIINSANITSGALLTASSTNITNTKSIIGASVNLTASNSITNSGASALIGATDSGGTLQLLAPTITNIDPTTATDSLATTAIIGLGKVNLAGGVDSSGKLIAANAITNSSALIQSGGDLVIKTDTLNNQRTSLDVSSQYQIALDSAAVNAIQIAAGQLDQNGNPYGLSGRAGVRYSTLNPYPAWFATMPGGNPPDTGCHGGSCNSDYGYTIYSGTAAQQAVLNISPAAMIQSGANAGLLAGAINNAQSSITAIGNLDTGSANINNAVKNVNAQVTYDGVWHRLTYKNVDQIYSTFSNDVHTYTEHVYGASITAGGTLINTGGSVNNGGSSGNSSTVGGSGSSFVNISNSQSAGLYAINPKGITVPSGGLYYPATNASANYIIQTNPAFTNNRNWLSGSYMLAALSSSPQQLMKQVGDGYYEQQLVAQQVIGIAGVNILAGYTDTEDQFMGLMNNAIAADKQFNFTLGTALTAAQIAQLKSNIVWLVKENVTLPDGTVTQALVPQVYLAAGKLAVASNGAVIAAKDISMTNLASVNNSGTIAAQNNLLLQSNTSINSNIGSTIAAGGAANLLANNNIDLNQTNINAASLGLQAGKDINLLASNVNVANNVQLIAGNDINIAAKSVEAGYNNGASIVSQTNNTGSSLNVGGSTTANAGRDLNVVGSTINTASAALVAGSNINLTASKDSKSFANSFGNSSLNEKVNASAINATGVINAQAGSDINLTSSNLASANGAINVNAGNNINIVAMGETHNSTTITSSESGGLISSTKTTTTTINNSTTQMASNVSGSAVNMISGSNTNITASNITATKSGDINLTAGGNLSILAGANTALYQSSSQTSGDFLGHSGKSSDNKDQTTAASTTITGGAIKMQSAGDTTLQAAKITGNTLAMNVGSTLNIDAAIESQNQSHSSKGNDLMTQNSSGSGSNTQSLNYTTINLQDAQGNNQNPILNAANGIVIGARLLPSMGTSSGSGGAPSPTITVDLKQQAAQLATQPGLSYLGELTKRNDVTWQKVQLASQSWNYSQSGLSQSGGIIIAIAVAIATYGAGAALAGATLGAEVTAAGAVAGSTVVTTEVGGIALAATTTTAATATTAATTVTAYTAAGAALNAGLSSLASQAAVSLANNQGDIGKTLQAMGSSAAVKNTVAAMLVAGIGGAVADSGGVTQVASKTAAGCGSGAISGSGCVGGAAFGAVTSTAAYGYQSVLGYSANAGPGFNPENPVYTPDEITHQQPPNYQGANVIGVNNSDALIPQGGLVSKILNYVPFINATAGVHDYIFNSKLLDQTTFNNIATMVPSATVAIPAALGNPNLNWIGTTNTNAINKK